MLGHAAVHGAGTSWLMEEQGGSWDDPGRFIPNRNKWPGVMGEAVTADSSGDGVAVAAVKSQEQRKQQNLFPEQ